MRVLHAPLGIGGNAASLARAERAVGLRSHAVSIAPPPFGYEFDEVLWQPGASLLARERGRWRLFRRALTDYDVIHFNFGQSILTWGGLFSNRARLGAVERVLLALAPQLELLDLPALRRAGKVIAVTYQGDDARQGDVALRTQEVSIAAAVEPGYYSSWSDRRKRERIARFARYADLIYALNPDLLHVLPPHARFLPYANVDPREWRYVGVAPGIERRDPVVVHAPSHRAAKGSPLVLAACAALRAEGLRFELRMVENMNHDQARRVYEAADIVVDQLYAGWYGGLAVEAMALGKPVVAYLRENDLGFLPVAMRDALPIVRARPDDIASVLRRLLTVERGRLAELGRAGRAFVERWHDPLDIAARLRDDYASAVARRAP